MRCTFCFNSEMAETRRAAVIRNRFWRLACDRPICQYRLWSATVKDTARWLRGEH